MKSFFKKHGWYPILVFIPVILFGFLSAFPAHALTLNGVDTSLPFSAKDIDAIAVTLKADTDEAITLTKILNDQRPTYKDINSFKSLLIKTLANPTPKEIDQIMAGAFTANSWIKYKSRKLFEVKI